MEKRKWLWKRKPSDKSPGENESSGSISSHSERYSDDQEAFKSSPNHNTQSPEVTSKAVIITEDFNNGSSNEDMSDGVKSLKEKLSAALVNVSAKEDLVKQHAKVAEEAVAGWEKAENEVVVLKQQLESAVQQNSILEDRVSHLDGALKELVRQLRQARDEQEQKIHVAVVKKTSEWETTKLKLENQLLELKNEAEAAKSVSSNVDYDLYRKLDYLEEENSALKLELQSQSEELEIRTIERDLSTQAAETASKQHLDSIKKVAKLEAECRRLKSTACKTSPVNDHKSTTASSICVESLTDGQSDSGERLSLGDLDAHKTSSSETKKYEASCPDSWASTLMAELGQFKNEKDVNRNLQASSGRIDLMDDFLEMERLAALPETKKESHSALSEVSNPSISGESLLRAELEGMICRTAELEEKIGKLEAQRAEMETALTKSEEYVQAYQLQLQEAELQLDELQKELNIARETKQVVESRLICMEAEARTLLSKVDTLEVEVQKEKALSAEIAVKCQELEVELSRERQEIELQKNAELQLDDLQKELNIARETKQVVESRLISVEAEARTMSSKVDTLEVEVQKEKALSAEIAGKCRELQEELSRKRQEIELQKNAELQLDELQKELNIAKETKQVVESRLISMEADARTMSSKVDTLEVEVQKEKALSAEIAVKCRELREELSRKRQEIELQKNASSNGELKIKQEDLSVAAGKLAECQKTIASLGNQLKSLATLEDFLIDTANLPEFSAGASLINKADGELWKLHCNGTFSPKRDSDSSRIADESSGPLINKEEENLPPSSSLAASSAALSNHINSEKNRNGFAKFFSRTKSGIRLEI